LVDVHNRLVYRFMVWLMYIIDWFIDPWFGLCTECIGLLVHGSVDVHNILVYRSMVWLMYIIDWFIGPWFG